MDMNLSSCQFIKCACVCILRLIICYCNQRTNHTLIHFNISDGKHPTCNATLLNFLETELDRSKKIEQ